jgi:hypothetical protein
MGEFLLLGLSAVGKVTFFSQKPFGLSGSTELAEVSPKSSGRSLASD